jgi:hypothetical protein
MRQEPKKKKKQEEEKECLLDIFRPQFCDGPTLAQHTGKWTLFIVGILKLLKSAFR